MNGVHNVLCASGWWARRAESELIPFGLDGIDLGDDVLEIGPGFGATTRVLVQRLGKVNVLELDALYCRRLRAELGDSVSVTQGDATRLPYPDGRFSSVLCFTMLHSRWRHAEPDRPRHASTPARDGRDDRPRGEGRRPLVPLAGRQALGLVRRSGRARRPLHAVG